MINKLNKQKIGVVIIGRNEGDRLKRCVRSVLGDNVVVVYVDSNSKDDSVSFCERHGVFVIELDMSISFSAARARNEGMRWFIRQYPELPYIQFIDGDCELIAGWFEHALQNMHSNSTLSIVCGRRKERCPEQSIYNQLCDIEWNTSIGLTDSCGGDFMARIKSLMEVGGFNPAIIAGEEPDLCYRLRMKGWKIERLDIDMTWHDAMILHFAQWWRRTLRSGHAYAHNLVLHWSGSEKNNLRSVLSIIGWGIVMPGVFLISILTGELIIGLLVVFLYTIMVYRITRFMTIQKHYPLGMAIRYGFFTMLGKIPQMIGATQFCVKWFSSNDFEIIEYK